MISLRTWESGNLEAVTLSHLFNCAQVKLFALAKLSVYRSLHPVHFQKKMP